ncbi:hypothetical protein BHM03_00061224, partial [Ensete ventricosum]
MAGLREWFSQTDENYDVSKMPLMVNMTAQTPPIKKDRKTQENSVQPNSSQYQMHGASRHPVMLDEDSDDDEDYQIPEREQEVGRLLLLIPAGKHLMELVAVDWFKDVKRIDHVARRKGCAVQATAPKQLPNLFAISTCTARIGRYIPVRQVTDTRTARYRAVPPKIDRRQSILAVGSRLKKKLTVGGQLRKKKGRRRGKEEKKKRRIPRPRAVLAHVSSPPAGRPRSQPLFLPCEETEHLPARGERSRR